MPEKKGHALTVLVVVFLVLLYTAPALAFVVAIVGGFALFSYLRQQPRIINQQTISMPTFDLSGFMARLRRTGMLVVFTIAALVLLVRMIVVIPAGETGVYHVFGKVRDNELSSGIHLVNPLASVVRMSIRTEQYTMSMATTEGERLGDDSIEALTKEGLKVNLDITVLYHLLEDRASDVYRELGIEYPEKVIRPEVRSAIREIIARYDAKDIYSEKREQAVNEIQSQLDTSLGARGIAVESVLLRNVSLPAMLTQAIESKLTAEQEAQRYDFVLQQEEKEAERKRIEAAGQRDAQQIINESLTDRYLQYLYIQNLEKREGTIYVPYDLPLLKGL